jgi:hypothetical protein
MAKYHFPEKGIIVEAQNLREARASLEKPKKKKVTRKKKSDKDE